MSYILTEEVNDKNLSKRGTILMRALAHVMDRNAKFAKRKHEYNTIINIVRDAEKKLEHEHPSQMGAESLIQKTIDGMEDRRVEAREQVSLLESQKEMDLKREAYLHEALVENGYFEWRNRSLIVTSFGRHPDFKKRSENETDPLRIWQVDSKKTMERFIEDFKACLPEGVPTEAFDFHLMNDRPAGQKGDVGAVTFNQVFDDDVRKAVIKMTGINLDAVQEDEPEKVDELKKKGRWGKAMEFDDAQYLASGMPYMIETDTPSVGMGRLTIEILRSEDPVEALKKIEFNRQMPLMNISQYAAANEDLKAFQEESFGGPIGRTRDGFERAMNICMGHFAKEYNKGLNINKIISVIDDEMSRGMSRDTPGPSL